MSALGSYAVLRRPALSACAALASEIRTESSGWGIFKKTRIVGKEPFEEAWAAALVEEVDFDYSGYALGNYLDAQAEINQIPNLSDQTPLGRALSKAFTAAFVFEATQSYPELTAARIAVWCREEYGEEAIDLPEAVEAAQKFFVEGLSKVNEQNLVAFIIS